MGYILYVRKKSGIIFEWDRFDSYIEADISAIDLMGKYNIIDYYIECESERILFRYGVS